MPPVPIVVLSLVFLLIAIRRIGTFRLRIWQIMLGGAIVVLLTRQIAPMAALRAINLDVIVFLFGMFVVGQALAASGYLSYLSYSAFSKARSPRLVLLAILFGMGLTSAFLMNDTLAVVGTPVALALAKQRNLSSKPMLLTLAFAVTIGSVMSPIGNPQNLLIALNGNMANPFISFLKYLSVPTVVNLLLTFLLLMVFYRKEMRPHLNLFFEQKLAYDALLSEELITNKRLASLSKVSLALIVLLVLTRIVLVFTHVPFDLRLTYIAVLAAAPLVLFSPRRFTIVKNIDWSTLVFFGAMFILMESVWQSGFFQSIINGLQVNIVSIGMIFLISVLLSQVLSNVPLVALYLPLLTHAGASTKEMVALAAGSTLAGNLFILGAASNVIIIQNAEEKSGETLTFWEFARIGVPLTMVNVLTYWLYLELV